MRYQPDTTSDTELLLEVVSEIKELVLPEVDVADIEVHPVKGLKHLGKFVRGTSSSPVIVVSLRAIKKACDKYDVDEYTGIQSTIMHELGHALQERHGLPMKEDQAEEFAKQFWLNGEVLRFW